MVLFVAYVWGATLIIFQKKNEKAMWVAVIIGAIAMVTALGLSFVVIRRTQHHFKNTQNAADGTDVQADLDVCDCCNTGGFMVVPRYGVVHLSTE